MTKQGIIDFCIKITESGFESSASGIIELMYQKRTFDGNYRSLRTMPCTQSLSTWLTRNPNFEYTGEYDDKNARIIRRI